MLKHNIIEIYEMINELDDFFNSMMRKSFTVGGCVGTSIVKYAIDAALSYTTFNKILVIDGCNDYVVSMKKPLCNYMYYADLFAEVLVDSSMMYDPFKPRILNPQPEYRRVVDLTLLNYYECIIINNAHMIPSDYRFDIYNNFEGKILDIVDPFDVYGELYVATPTITDTLNKQSKMVGFARHLYGIETRSIDKKIGGSLEERKINKRSIGKLDTNQYVVDDDEFANVIRLKQWQSPIRKHHKLYVISDHTYVYPDQCGGRRCITANSLLHVTNPNYMTLTEMRIHGSKLVVRGDVSYDEGTPIHVMHVIPGNILSVWEACHHRYPQTIFIQTKKDDHTRRNYYSLLKNSVNLVICKM